MYKRMTTEEKFKYLKGKVLGDIGFGFLFGTLISTFLILFNVVKIKNDDTLLCLLFGSGCILTLIIIKLVFPYNVFSKNLQITDGYIDKRRHRSDGDGHSDLVASARTFDGSKETRYKRIPYYFVRGRIPVKVIVYKNKAREFFLTDESYAYVDESLTETEKEAMKISTIIGIIFIIIFILGFVSVFVLN